ncbi:uncharacterized protein MELLADRAFT_109277 [Melampsora larici-populina 98AG31]|uniref:Uncharacterized protein n=1 Tax=Melampsora larici-populina (strain 98AG31 / pathotype 3-4-7) TaxID=747676 RepID=F4RVY6_MELLP|nr:uncharacterized protein MELLADRAFT_109277 [Melampsora larici-populina 98AG31]EGG03503.1 hypothetical protein MELLADRAFT_109277 [Melampsora larici-populina 98AG31]
MRGLARDGLAPIASEKPEKHRYMCDANFQRNTFVAMYIHSTSVTWSSCVERSFGKSTSAPDIVPTCLTSTLQPRIARATHTLPTAPILLPLRLGQPVAHQPVLQIRPGPHPLRHCLRAMTMYPVHQAFCQANYVHLHLTSIGSSTFRASDEASLDPDSLSIMP